MYKPVPEGMYTFLAQGLFSFKYLLKDSLTWAVDCKKKRKCLIFHQIFMKYLQSQTQHLSCTTQREYFKISLHCLHYTHTAGLHIIIRTQSKNKLIEAILALHTPRPTTHTECLWEHLWCEQWRMKSSGWVWFSSPWGPFPSHRNATHTHRYTPHIAINADTSHKHTRTSPALALILSLYLLLSSREAWIFLPPCRSHLRSSQKLNSLGGLLFTQGKFVVAIRFV